MKYTLYIPFVNRPDLLEQAIRSIEPMFGNVVIFDNSNGGLPVEYLTDPRVRVYVPVTPLNFTHTQNAMQALSRANGDEVLMFMHNDGEALNGAAMAFLKATEAVFRSGQKWGAIFTLYDVLCSFNMEAVNSVGSWDVQFQQYVSDTDYYHRLRLLGWPIIESGLNAERNQNVCGVFHHNGTSNTIKADPLLMAITQFRNSFDHFYYSWKWGGVQGKERYGTPYQGIKIANKR